MDADDAQELLVTRDVDAVRRGFLNLDGVEVFDLRLLHEFPAADQDGAAPAFPEVRHDGFHAAGDDGGGAFVLRHFPFLFAHVFLDGHRQRMDGVHFRRRG